MHTVFDIHYRIYSVPTHEKKTVAITTVYSAPDDGRKGRPKHAEFLTPNKEHKKVASRWHLYDQYLLRCYVLSIDRRAFFFRIKHSRKDGFHLNCLNQSECNMNFGNVGEYSPTGKAYHPGRTSDLL